MVIASRWNSLEKLLTTTIGSRSGGWYANDSSPHDGVPSVSRPAGDTIQRSTT
jgi:hypothetical protein